MLNTGFISTVFAVFTYAFKKYFLNFVTY